MAGTLALAATALLTAGGCAVELDGDEPTATSVGEIGAGSGSGRSYRCFPCDPAGLNDWILEQAEAFANQILGYAVGASATCIDLGQGGSECLVWFATNDEGCQTLKVDCVAATGGDTIRCSSLGCDCSSQGCD